MNNSLKTMATSICTNTSTSMVDATPASISANKTKENITSANEGNYSNCIINSRTLHCCSGNDSSNGGGGGGGVGGHKTIDIENGNSCRNMKCGNSTICGNDRINQRQDQNRNFNRSLNSSMNLEPRKISFCNEWRSYHTDVTTMLQTPSGSEKFRTNFSFRQAQIPEGYPKMDYQRNPRRESFVSEFSRKLAEGYDIWEDEDRPIINWRWPQLPIRKNRTHELRTIANRERINKMQEREKQMNKRNTRLTAPAEKKETAWWEKSKNGSIRMKTATPRAIPQTNRTLWSGSSTTNSVRQNFLTKRGAIYTARR